MPGMTTSSLYTIQLIEGEGDAFGTLGEKALFKVLEEEANKSANH
jgi:hypothetical protein